MKLALAVDRNAYPAAGGVQHAILVAGAGKIHVCQLEPTVVPFLAAVPVVVVEF